MSGKTVLIVEGPDDVHVIKAICGSHSLGKIGELRPYGGIDPLLEGLPVALKESEVEAIGIVLDADANVAARWQAVRSKLEAANYTVPVSPPVQGLVLPGSAETLRPKVGVWLMPDNVVPGILENFLKFLVPKDDTLFPRVEAFVDGLPAPDIKFHEVARPKALIHAWLALQSEPGRPMGQAITARYLDAKMPATGNFVAWLRATFF